MIRAVLHNNIDAFIKWHDDYAIIGTVIGVVSMLVFKKPENLDINYLKTEKTKFKILNRGISDTLYSICFDFENNNIDEHQFDLEADIKTNGNLEVYLINENELKNINEIISKKLLQKKYFQQKLLQIY